MSEPEQLDLLNDPANDPRSWDEWFRSLPASGPSNKDEPEEEDEA